jgi:putative autoinducer-2 (AI-2) aldolase
VDSELEVLEFVHDGMQRGAIGVNLGRNVWQNDFPVAIIRAIRYVVHENGTAQEAHELFQSLKAGVA